MSLLDCLKSAADQKEITPQEAARLKGLYEELLRHNADDGPNAAPHAARQALRDLLEADGREKQRQAALTLKVMNERWRDVKAFRRARFTRDGLKIEGGDKPDIGEAVLHTLEHFGGANFSSVNGRKLAIIGQAHQRMEALLYTFRRHWAGGDWFRHGQAQLDNVVSEAFGKGTGDDAAKGLAQAWTATAEWLRRRYNAAGGHIAKLENWGLPQLHDAQALLKAGRDTWKEFITPMLNVSRMRHPLTGAPVTAGDLNDMLDHVFDAVTQEGWATREARRQRYGIGAIANQNAEHRFLVFNGPEDWVRYQKAFGEGDAFAAMMTYVNRMARDIAAMEILGPNPAATLEWFKQLIRKEGMKAGAGQEALLPFRGKRAVDYANGRIDKIERMWSSMRGELETPVNGKWAGGFAAVRNIITSSVLGGATLASVPGDTATSLVARAFTGIPQAGFVRDIAHGFTASGQREAVEAGLILDSAMHTFHTQARYVGSFSGPEWSRYISDRVLTYSGLTPWTSAARHGFSLAFMRELAVRAGDSLETLPRALQDTLKRWGLSDQWDKIRSARIDEGDTVRLLRPQEIAAVDQRLADRYLEMVNGETEFAVPTGSTRAKTFLVSTDQPGTFWGEVTRSAAQFKSFAAVFVMLNGMRILPMIASKDGRIVARGARYAGALLIGTTLAGALAIQLKQVTQGRDPRNMNDRKFWGAALLQGGGIGIFGDFLFSDLNRFGGGLPTTLSGPTVQHLWDLWTLTGGNMMEIAEGKKETHAGREAINVLRANTPGGSIWYLRLAYERFVLDQLQYLADPKANKAFKQRQQWWKREMGQDFYWAPGDTAPARGPDFGAMWR